MKKIVLLGYMGSGKSTIGQKLAEALNLPFIDLDQEIETNLQKTIPAIFKERGEIYFRKIEHQTFNHLLDENKSIILSLGGGTPCYANNHLKLQESDVISIYLKASIKTLVERLENEKEHRPVLNQNTDDTLETFVAKQLFERSYFYHQAKHTLIVDNKSISDIVDEIIKIVN
ncbi:shikimate kinase [Myroides injenensis]|uniref:shikimate kinase n=1 Tax=Myroides injenensis TaxID=1183151 RepID=UPI000287A7CB|nr:shikimate kinase [Myroides injenensis]